MTEKQQIQAEINLLQKRLDKCDEVEPFTCKGEWYTTSEGYPSYISNSRSLRKYFNYWQTKEIAKKAYELQLRHRKMLSFVSQHQKLGVGKWYARQYPNGKWEIYKSSTDYYYPDAVMMNEETAERMLEAIENGSLNLEEK